MKLCPRHGIYLNPRNKKFCVACIFAKEINEECNYRNWYPGLYKKNIK